MSARPADDRLRRQGRRRSPPAPGLEAILQSSAHDRSQDLQTADRVIRLFRRKLLALNSLTQEAYGFSSLARLSSQRRHRQAGRRAGERAGGFDDGSSRGGGD